MKYEIKPGNRSGDHGSRAPNPSGNQEAFSLKAITRVAPHRLHLGPQGPSLRFQPPCPRATHSLLPAAKPLTPSPTLLKTVVSSSQESVLCCK